MKCCICKKEIKQKDKISYMSFFEVVCDSDLCFDEYVERLEEC